MNNLPIFDSTNYPTILPVEGLIYSYKPPGMVRVKGNVQGDSFILDSSQERWDVSYGGTTYTINWNHTSFAGVDNSLIALWRHHLTEELQSKSPPTVYEKYMFFRHISHQLNSNLSLDSILAIFSQLYAKNRRENFSDFRVFYNWGISHDIPLFDRRIQKIVNDLSAPKQNPYSSIFLQQNYITNEQEVRILQYIDMQLSAVESINENEFDIDLYIEFRNITLVLLVYEIAPRPLQIFMLEQCDFKEIKVDGDCYFSIRLRRNKNRHLGDDYTSSRDISVRLGNALKKLTQLNKILLMKPASKDSPIFLNDRGNRWGASAISIVVSKALESMFGIEKLDIEGALTPFRHHLGQALADQGAPPSVIADRLGHSTEVAARAYITATPSIAKIKTRALGENETYLYLMKSLMTGTIIRREDLNDATSIVRGTVGMHYIEGIGACDVNGNCHSNPVFACYTCRKFHPFVDGPHDRVIGALQDQAINFMATTIDLQHSRPIMQLEIAIESAKAVLRECKKHEV
ncbi:MAG: hypothetical protein PHD04_02925 [Candidatus Pacebacteria bacterium]|nr:hypothetical protein [Candidatus Paceibacterota bacterium]